MFERYDCWNNGIYHVSLHSVTHNSFVKSIPYLGVNLQKAICDVFEL